MVATPIGTWHVSEPKEFTEGFTSYAADWRTVRWNPGEYVARLTWDLWGSNIPMPRDVTVGIESAVLDGQYYSGIGGVNFDSTPVKKGLILYTLRLYPYEIPKCVGDGRLTLSEGWGWLNDQEKALDYIRANVTREMVASWQG